MRSVVFIIRHEIDGAFGLVINRPSDERFRDLLNESPSEITKSPSGPSFRDDDFVFLGSCVCEHCLHMCFAFFKAAFVF